MLIISLSTAPSLYSGMNGWLSQTKGLLVAARCPTSPLLIKARPRYESVANGREVVARIDGKSAVGYDGVASKPQLLTMRLLLVHHVVGSCGDSLSFAAGGLATHDAWGDDKFNWERFHLRCNKSARFYKERRCAPRRRSIHVLCTWNLRISKTFPGHRLASSVGKQ